MLWGVDPVTCNIQHFCVIIRKSLSCVADQEFEERDRCRVHRITQTALLWWSDSVILFHPSRRVDDVTSSQASVRWWRAAGQLFHFRFCSISSRDDSSFQLAATLYFTAMLAEVHVAVTFPMFIVYSASERLTPPLVFKIRCLKAMAWPKHRWKAIIRHMFCVPCSFPARVAQQAGVTCNYILLFIYSRAAFFRAVGSGAGL